MKLVKKLQGLLHNDESIILHRSLLDIWLGTRALLVLICMFWFSSIYSYKICPSFAVYYCILKFTSCRHYRISELVIALSSSPSMSEIQNCFLWDERQPIFESQDSEEIIRASRSDTWLANMNAIISTYNYEIETFSLTICK